MNDEAAFLTTLLLSPRDITARLVYADWLQEQGRIKDEKEIRREAEQIQNGTALGWAKTPEEIKDIHDAHARSHAASQWNIRWRQLLIGAARAAGRSSVEQYVQIHVDCGATWHWSSDPLPPTCRVGSFSPRRRKNFTWNKKGFSLGRIISTAVEFAQAAILHAALREESLRRADRSRREALVLQKRFPSARLHGGNDGLVHFSIARTKKEMTAMLQVLKDHGFLPSEEPE